MGNYPITPHYQILLEDKENDKKERKININLIGRINSLESKKFVGIIGPFKVGKTFIYRAILNHYKKGTLNQSNFGVNTKGVYIDDLNEQIAILDSEGLDQPVGNYSTEFTKDWIMECMCRLCYLIVFVVERFNDPALEMIKEIIERCEEKTTILILHNQMSIDKEIDLKNSVSMYLEHIGRNTQKGEVVNTKGFVKKSEIKFPQWNRFEFKINDKKVLNLVASRGVSSINNECMDGLREEINAGARKADELSFETIVREALEVVIGKHCSQAPSVNNLQGAPGTLLTLPEQLLLKTDVLATKGKALYTFTTPIRVDTDVSSQKLKLKVGTWISILYINTPFRVHTCSGDLKTTEDQDELDQKQDQFNDLIGVNFIGFKKIQLSYKEKFKGSTIDRLIIIYSPYSLIIGDNSKQVFCDNWKFKPGRDCHRSIVVVNK